MPKPYEERYREGQFRGRGRYGPEGRGFRGRGWDEAPAWPGDEEAERRRWADEREREHERLYGRDHGHRYEHERGYRGGSRYSEPRGWDEPAPRGGSEPWGGAGEHWPGDYDRAEPGYGWSSYVGGGVPPTDYGRWYPGAYGTYREYAGRVGSPWGPERGWGYAGRGPKGYRRSDPRILEDVCDRLAEAPDVDASDIEVSVSQGEVTLAGTVHERAQKRRSEDLIESISGVREVHNNLRVSTRPEGEPAPGQQDVVGTGRRTAGTTGR